VRRQHRRASIAHPPVVHRRQRPERLGVEDERRRIRVAGPEQESTDQVGRGQSWAQTGPDHDRVVLVVQDPGQGGFGSISSTSSSGKAIVVASTTLAANSGWSDSGTARVTSPTPARPAARHTSSAAPA
jgi:hypothetical protein